MLHNSYTHAPRNLRIFVTQRPEAVAHEHSEGATKGLRVYKIVYSTMHVYNCIRLYLQDSVVLLSAVA